VLLQRLALLLPLRSSGVPTDCGCGRASQRELPRAVDGRALLKLLLLLAAKLPAVCMLSVLPLWQLSAARLCCPSAVTSLGAAPPSFCVEDCCCCCCCCCRRCCSSCGAAVAVALQLALRLPVGDDGLLLRAAGEDAAGAYLTLR
jgi:hypothetical protein